MRDARGRKMPAGAPTLPTRIRRPAARLFEDENIFLGAHLFQDLRPDAYRYFA